MPGLMPESEQSTEVTEQIFGSPFLRAVNPAKEYWNLTALAQKRIETNDIPPHFTVSMRIVLQRLHDTGPNEADELSDWLNITNRATLEVLNRLGGYGYVERAQSPTTTV